MNSKLMIIDNVPVEIADEKNILAVIRKAGIDMPTFCYYSELSLYGACRMCMVEDERGNIHAACSTPPRKGMKIFTNTPRLRKHRKLILELLLSNHCRDCTACEKCGHCKLQDLAHRFGIREIRFDNTCKDELLDTSSAAIVRNPSKCILCGDCVRVCEEVQNIGAIDFAFRGSKMQISTAFNEPISATNCVGCGKCAAVCPTGAIVVKNDTAKLWKDLSDKNKRVVAQIAPAVRVGLGNELAVADGKNAMGRIVAALRRIGFDEVFDTAVGADLTVMEEAAEFMQRLESGAQLPLFTSCCPAWVQHVENRHPELLRHISSCKSPMEMFAPVLKEHYKEDKRDTVMVAIMPCTAKKIEAARKEFTRRGIPDVDYVITTQELVQMINEAGLIFSDIEPESSDMPFGTISGAGLIFGVTGGVTEAVIRRIAGDKSRAALQAIAFTGVRGLEGVKEFTLELEDREVRIAVVSGLKNADTLIEQIKSGEAQYDFVEVMACPNGCINGGGQPFTNDAGRRERSDGLYRADRMSNIKRSEDNPAVLALYDGLLKGRTHELLHVDYCYKK